MQMWRLMKGITRESFVVESGLEAEMTRVNHSTATSDQMILMLQTDAFPRSQ